MSDYVTVSQFSEKYGLSKSVVQKYCRNGQIHGAKKIDNRWQIPINAKLPQNSKIASKLLMRLIQEKTSHLSGGIYHKTQIELTYNSNHIEGSQLTNEQTRYIFETNTIGLMDDVVNVDDIVETANHFRCFDYILEQATKPLSEKIIKQLHAYLKSGTSDSRKDWFVVGDYKRLPNEVGGQETTAPEYVAIKMRQLLQEYHQQDTKDLQTLLDFHVRFEKIHPFQDGNGRVGRLILFKECLKYDIVPFIIEDQLKYFYYRGLKEWNDDVNYLLDTCLTAQDKYKSYLDYFQIPYED